MNLFTKTETDSQTENKLMVIKGEMEEVGYIGSMGYIWEYINRCTLLYKK